MYVKPKMKLFIAIIFAVLISLAIVEVTYYLIPAQQPVSSSSSPLPGPYSTQQPFLSSQNYVWLLATCFIVAVGVTVSTLLFLKKRRLRKSNC
jgi:uncharacterized membrane protein YjgN (DUF898 family)